MLKAESNETSPWLTNGYAIADRDDVVRRWSSLRPRVYYYTSGTADWSACPRMLSRMARTHHNHGARERKKAEPMHPGIITRSLAHGIKTSIYETSSSL